MNVSNQTSRQTFNRFAPWILKVQFLSSRSFTSCLKFPTTNLQNNPIYHFFLANIPQLVHTSDVSNLSSVFLRFLHPLSLRSVLLIQLPWMSTILIFQSFMSLVYNSSYFTFFLTWSMQIALNKHYHRKRDSTRRQVYDCINSAQKSGQSPRLNAKKQCPEFTECLTLNHNFLSHAWREWELCAMEDFHHKLFYDPLIAESHASVRPSWRISGMFS